jgi:hypothetical protein
VDVCFVELSHEKIESHYSSYLPSSVPLESRSSDGVRIRNPLGGAKSMKVAQRRASTAP